MKNHTKISFLWAILLSVFILLSGFNNISAQSAPTPNPVLRKQSEPDPVPTPMIDDSEPIKINTELVSVLFTAEGKDRRLLTDLKKEDVRLLENNQPQEIFSFTRQTELPLSIVILIDTSVSQERTLPDEKLAAQSFIQNVIRPAKDEAAIVSFTGDATLEQGLTSNVERIRRAIDRVEFVPPAGYLGGGVIMGGNQLTQGTTAIWDAIWATSGEILSDAPEKTRRAIILLTDGINTSGSKNLDNAVQSALRADAVVYAIGIRGGYDGIDTKGLKEITEQTGGHAFFPSNEAELRGAFLQIQNELRSQFLIAYESSNQKRDGAYRQIEIEVINPQLTKQKVRLNYRPGYFAKREPEINR